MTSILRIYRDRRREETRKLIEDGLGKHKRGNSIEEKLEEVKRREEFLIRFL